MREKIKQYVKKWGNQGYSDGLPDEVPRELERLQLAPSWRAIAMAILKNDVRLLGFSSPVSPWYMELKRIEFSSTEKQMRLL